MNGSNLITNIRNSLYPEEAFEIHKGIGIENVENQIQKVGGIYHACIREGYYNVLVSFAMSD